MSKKVALTPHEIELLPKAVKFIQASIHAGNGVPPFEDIRRELSCGQSAVKALRAHIISNKLVEMPQEVMEKEINEIEKDKWTIGLNKTSIHTLEELVAFCKIDLEIWEVERFVANKWEMGYKDDEGKAHTTPLYQIKAFLRRKQFSTLEHYAKDNARLRSQNAKLGLQVRSERELAQRLAENHAGFDDFITNMDEFRRVMNPAGDVDLPTSRILINDPAILPAVKSNHTEDAVLLLSDTHFGDRISREDTSGFPEFDLVIAGNRFGYIIGKAKQCLALHRSMYPIKKLIVWIGGDIGNGSLHDSPQSNELFVPAQVDFSYHMLKFAIQDLLTLTVPDEQGRVVVEEIELLFTVGNHMRMDEKMPHKYQAQRTLDWLIYRSVIDKFSDNPKVKIKQEMAPYIFHTIRGHRHLFAHGMQVGYRNSPDAQCKSMGSFIDRVRALFDSPEWRRKNNLQGETFARICIGDIHVPVSFPRLLSNGSLNGQNELGVNWVMEPIPAGQQMFGVSENHMETWKYFLECSHIQKETSHFNNYGAFAQEYAAKFGR